MGAQRVPARVVALGEMVVEQPARAGGELLAAIATVLFVREAIRLVNLRDQPREIARGRVSVEGWTAGLIVGIAGVVTMGSVTGYALDEGQSALGAACGISAMWSLLNAAVAAIAVGVLVRSRLRQRADWKDLDFIEAHAPRNGRPPETVEEYRALRWNSDPPSASWWRNVGWGQRR